MYDEAIRNLLKKIPVLPKKIVVSYLMNVYGLTANLAAQAIHHACRSRACYDKNDGTIAFVPYLQNDSSYKNKAAALRVAMEFLPDSKDFIVGTIPWLIAFIRNQYLVQICYIGREMELATSTMIAQNPVPADEREHIKRIAIIEDPTRAEYVKGAGFAYLCTVDDNFNLKIVAKASSEEAAWSNVPEK